MSDRPVPGDKPTDPKLQALREAGTVNPRPQDVSDPAFCDSEFFDPRDFVQVKYEMLRRVRVERQPVGTATKKFGVSRPTFYKAQADFEQNGLAGLLPAKRGPRGPHKLTGQAMDFLNRCLAQDSSLEATDLSERMEQELGLRVHPRTIERALARAKKKTPLSSPSARTETTVPLVDAYEQLRHDALDPLRCGHGLPGFGILLLRGMATWLRACAAVAPTPITLSATSTSATLRLPAGVQHEVIHVLATMALGTALEGRR